MRGRANAPVETGDVVDTLPDGRGVLRADGKAVFVEGALAGERVSFRRVRRRRSFDEAALVEVLDASAERIEPRCAYFGTCGGCTLQHLSAQSQRDLKQRVLLDNLARLGDVRPGRVLEPVAGPAWGYRRKARLAVRDVPGKGRVLVGFRERHKPYVTDMRRCPVLHPDVGERLEALSMLLGELGLRDRIPQIEVGIGDAGGALVFRVLDTPAAADVERLRAFQAATGLQVLLQPAGPDSVTPLPGDPPPPELAYRLAAYDAEIRFRPADFVQVNGVVNAALVERAVGLLAPAPKHRVLDLFCGLGNFSLPLARHAGHVLGIEGDPAMVARARANAARSGLVNLDFAAVDLAAPDALAGHAAGGFDAVLIDPPRTGADAVLADVAGTGAARIVYVSCHPGTLARDAGRLVHGLGYRLEAAGIVDMFPQTSHVESLALFIRDGA